MKMHRSNWLPLETALFVVFVSVLQISVQVPGFTEYPGNTTAPLNTSVTFTCAIEQQPFVVWVRNGLQLTSPDILAHLATRGIFVSNVTMDDSVYSLSITILASKENNGSMLHCIAGNTKFTQNTEGDAFTFSVFGNPLAATQASLSANSLHQLTLSWGPPFTHPGEVLSYTVLVQNLNTSSTELLEGLTTTSYTHSLTQEQATLCQTYQFTVSSSNAVGLSENVTTAQGVHPSAPGLFGLVSSRVVLVDQTLPGSQSYASVQLMFQAPQSCFPLEYNVTLASGGSSGSSPISTGPFPWSGPGRELVSVSDLLEDMIYSANVTASNEFQFTSTSQEIGFYTTDIQSVSLQTFVNDTILIVCTFAEGTAARGCRVIITLNENTEIIFTLTRVELKAVSTQVLTIKPAAVMAQDIEANGVTATFSFTGSVTILGTLSTFTSTSGSGTATSSSTILSLSTTPTEPTSTNPSNSNNQPFSGQSLFTIVIPAGVGVAILFLLVLVACCFICCCKRSGRKTRSNTLPHELNTQISVASLTTSHDYKEIYPQAPINIKQMSYNPLYGDALLQQSSTFEPPLPQTPRPSNGLSPHDAITLPSTLPPVYEEVTAGKLNAKLASNPQYGHVGGGGGGGVGVAAENPQYGAMVPLPEAAQNNEHMYASLKEPSSVLSGEVKGPTQYAQPYEQVPGSTLPIPTENNVAYSSPMSPSP